MKEQIVTAAVLWPDVAIGEKAIKHGDGTHSGSLILIGNQRIVASLMQAACRNQAIFDEKRSHGCPLCLDQLFSPFRQVALISRHVGQALVDHCLSAASLSLGERIP